MHSEDDHCRFTVTDSDLSDRLLMLSPALLCITGTDGYFKRVSQALQNKLGQTEAELLSRPFMEFVHPEDRQPNLSELSRLASGTPAVQFENRFRYADGSYRALLWHMTAVAQEGLMYATASDITESKQAHEKYQQLLNATPDSIIITDQQGKILEVNGATESQFGYSQDELEGRSIEVLIAARFRDQLRQHRNGFVTDPQPQSMAGGLPDLAAVRKDGSDFPAEISLALAQAHGRIIISAVRDISLRKRRERELEESRLGLVEDQRQIQGLLTRLMLAEESERRRIARGLHDDVGQSLLAAKLSLDELLERDSPGEADSSMQDVRRLVNHAIDAVRALSFELASAALYEVGVGAALQSECEHAEKCSGISFQSPENIAGHPIPEETKIILFRVGRELIRNVVRHSGARTARVSLSLSETGLRLTVQDDGRGFDVPTRFCVPDPASGFGLFSIDQQLESVGGRLGIASSGDSGTRAVVTVALDTRPDNK